MKKVAKKKTKARKRVRKAGPVVVKREEPVVESSATETTAPTETTETEVGQS